MPASATRFRDAFVDVDARFVDEMKSAVAHALVLTGSVETKTGLISTADSCVVLTFVDIFAIHFPEESWFRMETKFTKIAGIFPFSKV